MASIPIAPIDMGAPTRRRGWLRRPGRPSLGRTKLARTEARWGLLFLSPWLFGFVAFTFLPMIASLVFSVTNISLSQDRPLQFVGLENFTTMLSRSETWDSLRVTFTFAALSTP